MMRTRSAPSISTNCEPDTSVSNPSIAHGADGVSVSAEEKENAAVDLDDSEASKRVWTTALSVLKGF